MSSPWTEIKSRVITTLSDIISSPTSALECLTKYDIVEFRCKPVRTSRIEIKPVKVTHKLNKIQVYLKLIRWQFSLQIITTFPRFGRQ